MEDNEKTGEAVVDKKQEENSGNIKIALKQSRINEKRLKEENKRLRMQQSKASGDEAILTDDDISKLEDGDYSILNSRLKEKVGAEAEKIRSEFNAEREADAWVDGVITKYTIFSDSEVGDDAQVSLANYLGTCTPETPQEEIDQNVLAIAQRFSKYKTVPENSSDADLWGNSYAAELKPKSVGASSAAARAGSDVPAPKSFSDMASLASELTKEFVTSKFRR